MHALKLDPAKPLVLTCSMCGKDERHVRYLMAGTAGGHLCDACTVAAMKIVVKQRLKDFTKRSGRTVAQ
ncbi:MAG: hypothetical protein JNM17_10820 [Archangium sp.]|nr:hypothetical protein [Archangium sp.]